MKTLKHGWRWNGGKIYTQKDKMGYALVFNPSHHRANKAGYVLEHILIAEKAINKSLPPHVVIHHFPFFPSNSLIICQNQSYHKLLHQRYRAFQASNHSNWKKCRHCKKYDAPENLYLSGNKGIHRSCANDYLKEWRKKEMKYEF